MNEGANCIASEIIQAGFSTCLPAGRQAPNSKQFPNSNDLPTGRRAKITNNLSPSLDGRGVRGRVLITRLSLVI